MSETVDLCERARDALLAAGMRGVHAERLDRVKGKDGVVVRPLPPAVRREYYDGTRLVDYRFQVVAKSLDAIEAMGLCDEALRALRSADLASGNGSYEAVGRPEPDGDVEELAVGEDGRHVWAARLVQKIRRR